MIRTQELQYQFAGAATALHFPDVDLPQGGTLLVRGPSGCGKSTWLGLVSGLLRPTAGRVSVAGTVLNGLSGAERDAWRARQVGVLPQRLHLSDSLSVRDNLALVYFAAGLPVDHRAVTERLGALGVGDLAQRRPAQLSGGQAQRVALARALLLLPPLVLADEPTASLDDEACSLALDLLRRHTQAAGATLVVATHDSRAGQALVGATELRLSATPRGTP
jgi:putative ABC transport system ATP-binding protein